MAGHANSVFQFYSGNVRQHRNIKIVTVLTEIALYAPWLQYSACTFVHSFSMLEGPSFLLILIIFDMF